MHHLYTTGWWYWVKLYWDYFTLLSRRSFPLFFSRKNISDKSWNQRLGFEITTILGVKKKRKYWYLFLFDCRKHSLRKSLGSYLFSCLAWKSLCTNTYDFFFCVCEMNILFSLNLLIKKYPCVLRQFQLCAHEISRECHCNKQISNAFDIT